MQRVQTKLHVTAEADALHSISPVSYNFMIIMMFFFNREFIEEGVVDYAKKNPGTVVYVSPQSCRIPKIVAEYCKCTRPCVVSFQICMLFTAFKLLYNIKTLCRAMEENC